MVAEVPGLLRPSDCGAVHCALTLQHRQLRSHL